MPRSSAPTLGSSRSAALQQTQLQHVRSVLRSTARKCCEIRSWHQYHALPIRLLLCPAQRGKERNQGRRGQGGGSLGPQLEFPVQGMGEGGGGAEGGHVAQPGAVEGGGREHV